MILSNIKKITDLILSIRKDKDNFEMDFDNIEENLKLFDESHNERKNLIEALNQFSDRELLEVYTLFYYGRNIVGKVENAFWSYYDELDYNKDISREEIIDMLCCKTNLRIDFKNAFDNFE